MITEIAKAKVNLTLQILGRRPDGYHEVRTVLQSVRLHDTLTFTALIIKGRKAHVVHVGDSRAWHFRDGRLTCLTEDHTRPHPDQRHILYRALGIEERLRLDHQAVPLDVHDRLLLTSDGVHGMLSARQIEKLLGMRGSAEADAVALVEAALTPPR